MKTKSIPVLVVLLLALGSASMTGCKNSPDNSAAGQAHQYTCSMHPEVVADKPGKCPKCGMDLVEKK